MTFGIWKLKSHFDAWAQNVMFKREIYGAFAEHSKYGWNKAEAICTGNLNNMISKCLQINFPVTIVKCGLI